MSDTTVSAAPSAKVLAWDGPTRLFKWALVVAVVSAWASDKLGGGTPVWHIWNGYAVLVLVVFRLLWGVVGGSTARFTQFVASPATGLRYALDLVRGREAHYLGHNPLGGWMVVALILVPAGMAISGLFNADVDRMIIEGPLSAPLSDAAVGLAHRLHHWGFKLLQILVVLHVAAVVFHAVVKKERLVPAMVTGRKPAAAYADAAEATPGAIATAIGCLVAAAGIVWLGLRLAGA